MKRERQLHWDAAACFSVQFQRDNAKYFAECRDAFYSFEPSQSISVVLKNTPDWVRGAEGDTVFTLYVLPRSFGEQLQYLPDLSLPILNKSENDHLLSKKWQAVVGEANIRIGCVMRKLYSSYGLDMVVGQIKNIESC